jgi:hypothetical protein
MELLIGCGTNRDKRMGVAGQGEWSGLVTLDIEPSLNPDVVWDLNDLPLPFEAGAFDEIHAYEQVGTTCMTDYRPFYKGDFRICGASDDGQTVRFILQKVAN